MADEWNPRDLEKAAGWFAAAAAWLGAAWAFVAFGLRWALAWVRAIRLSDRLHDRFGRDPLDTLARELHARESDWREWQRVSGYIADEIRLCLYTADASGLCTAANPALCGLFKLDSRDMVGSGWTVRLNHDDARRCWESWHAAAADGRPWKDHYAIRLPDGTVIECESEAWPIQVSGQVVRYVGIVRPQNGDNR